MPISATPLPDGPTREAGRVIVLEAVDVRVDRDRRVAVAGVDVGDTGTGSHVPMVVTDTMLIYASQRSDGSAALWGIDKATGETIATIDVPEVSRYGMMTYVHNGHQFVLLQTGSSLTAMALPGWDEGMSTGAAH